MFYVPNRFMSIFNNVFSTTWESLIELERTVMPLPPRFQVEMSESEDWKQRLCKTENKPFKMYRMAKEEVLFQRPFDIFLFTLCQKPLKALRALQ